MSSKPNFDLMSVVWLFVTILIGIRSGRPGVLNQDSPLSFVVL